MGVMKSLNIERAMRGGHDAYARSPVSDRVVTGVCFLTKGASSMSTVQDPAAAGTSLAVYDQINDPAAFIDKLGDAIFKSGMFGCESAPQGRVLALECAARKAPPLMLAERYHLIKGKLSMKADAMLGDFLSRAGGSHRIVERTGDRAAIELAREGQTQVFELTWQQAIQEPFVYVGLESAVCEKLAAGGKGLKLKAKYSTPRGRMQMLWARVVSDGVRAMAPEIVAGCYTPEEISDFDYVQAGRGRKKDAATAAEDAGEAETVVDVEVEAAPFDGAASQGEPAGGTAREATPTIAADSMAEAEATAQADGGKTTTLLTTEAQLDAAVHQQVVAQAQQAPAAVTPPPTTGQATTQQVAVVNSLVVELGVNRDKLATMLARVGAAKVVDLSAAHCAALINVLESQKAKLAAGKN